MKAATVAPRERQILYSDPWVTRILAREKTQTRRIANPEFECPHGGPGDRLWAREAFLPMRSLCPGGPGVFSDSIDDASYVCFRDGGQVFRSGGYYPWGLDSPPDPRKWPPGRWRPSIHMPRWACRAVLVIVDVRLEPLQDMTREDAKAEGIPEYRCEFDGGPYTEYEDDLWRNRTSVENFAAIWDRRNKGPHSWEANPLVWAIEFRLIEGGGR